MLSDLNCTHVDAIVKNGISAYETEEGFSVVVLLLIISSLCLLLFGDKIGRRVAAGISFFAVALLLYSITTVGVIPFEIDCVARGSVALLGGLSAASLVLCLLNAGIFVLGTVAFGTVSHFVYESLSLPTSSSFVVLGKSSYYFLAVGGAGLVGAAVAMALKKQFIRLFSCVAGGGGIALGYHLVEERRGNEVGSAPLFVIVVVSAAGGLIFQHAMGRCRKRRRRKRRQEREEVDKV